MPALHDYALTIYDARFEGWLHWCEVDLLGACFESAGGSALSDARQSTLFRYHGGCFGCTAEVSTETKGRVRVLGFAACFALLVMEARARAASRDRALGRGLRTTTPARPARASTRKPAPSPCALCEGCSRCPPTSVSLSTAPSTLCCVSCSTDGVLGSRPPRMEHAWGLPPPTEDDVLVDDGSDALSTMFDDNVTFPVPRGVRSAAGAPHLSAPLLPPPSRSSLHPYARIVQQPPGVRATPTDSRDSWPTTSASEPQLPDDCWTTTAASSEPQQRSVSLVDTLVPPLYPLPPLSAAPSAPTSGRPYSTSATAALPPSGPSSRGRRVTVASAKKIGSPVGRGDRNPTDSSCPQVVAQHDASRDISGGGRPSSAPAFRVPASSGASSGTSAALATTASATQPPAPLVSAGPTREATLRESKLDHILKGLSDVAARISDAVAKVGDLSESVAVVTSKLETHGSAIDSMSHAVAGLRSTVKSTLHAVHVRSPNNGSGAEDESASGDEGVLGSDVDTSDETPSPRHDEPPASAEAPVTPIGKVRKVRKKDGDVKSAALHAQAAKRAEAAVKAMQAG